MVPSKFIKGIIPLSEYKKIKKTEYIIEYYKKIARYQNLNPTISIDYPWVTIENFRANFEFFDFEGDESITTDDFRDCIRKWGIRIYTKRQFTSNFSFD